MHTKVNSRLFEHQPFELPFLLDTPINEETGEHSYIGDNGRKYPSVTQFIREHWDKSDIDRWRKRVGEDEADWITGNAAARGRSLHTGIEHLLTNQGVPQFEDDPFNRMLFFRMKPELEKIDIIRCIEDPLCSHEWGIAGRPDCVAHYDGVYSVIDFKTSTKVKHKKWIIGYFLQCGFYGQMVKELYGQAPEQAVVLMGTENHPIAQVFREDMNNCINMAIQFMVNPVKFQKRVRKFQLNNKVAQL